MSLHLFIKFARLRVKERMEYRAAYLLGIVAQMIGYGATYLVIWLMLHRFKMIGGWTWPQIALLYSLDLFTYALGAAFTFSAMVELEDMVREGTVEGILVQPLNPYFHIVARKYNVGYAAHVLLSGGVLIWSLTHLDIHWTLSKVVYFLLILLSGVCMQAACLTFLGACSFTLIRSSVLFSLYYRLKSFISYPISVYGLAIQIILTIFVPLAFINMAYAVAV